MAEILSSNDPVRALRDAHEQGVLLGLVDVAGSKPRLDIDVLLLEKPDTFNLFVLALAELQQEKNTSKKWSYYQLGGIHGLPTTPWDGVDGGAKKGAGAGYCPHTSIKFITWHRAYLGYYEQTLYVAMLEIAERYPEPHKARYLKALQDFRLPYWDYYRPRAEKTTSFSGVTRPGGKTEFPYDYYLPRIFTEPNIMVRKPEDNNKLVPFDNPFFKFSFPSSGGFTEQEWGHAAGGKILQRKCTVRCPRDKDDAIGNADKMNAQINVVREQNNKIILDLIVARNLPLESFGTKKDSPDGSSNLESHHDQYHMMTGFAGDFSAPVRGYMGFVPTAGFDPVFWIHHCQIDRDAAIWQAANPKTWAVQQWAKNDLAADNLPFRRSRNGSSQVFWKGNDMQDFKRLGSYYKDAVDMAPDDVRRNFIRLYQWAVRRGVPGASIDSPPDDLKVLDLTKAQVYDFQGGAPSGVPEGVGPSVGSSAQFTMDAAVPDETEPSGGSEFVDAPSGAALQVDPAAVPPGSETRFAFTNMAQDNPNVAPATVDEEKYYRDWYIDDIVQRLAFNGPFVIYFFIGKFEDNVASYGTEPTMAGVTYVFTSSRELCDNCGEAGDLRQLVTDSTPITPMLLDYIGQGLDDLTPEKVVPFLIQNLRWRIVTADGQRKDPRSTPGFKVGVSSKLTPKDGDGLDGFLYAEYPQIVDTIVEQASSSPSDA